MFVKLVSAADTIVLVNRTQTGYDIDIFPPLNAQMARLAFDPALVCHSIFLGLSPQIRELQSTATVF